MQTHTSVHARRCCPQRHAWHSFLLITWKEIYSCAHIQTYTSISTSKSSECTTNSNVSKAHNRITNVSSTFCKRTHIINNNSIKRIMKYGNWVLSDKSCCARTNLLINVPLLCFDGWLWARAFRTFRRMLLMLNCDYNCGYAIKSFVFSPIFRISTEKHITFDSNRSSSIAYTVLIVENGVDDNDKWLLWCCVRGNSVEDTSKLNIRHKQRKRKLQQI